MFEIIVQKKLFVKSLAHVQAVVERRNVSAILSHLKLEATEGKLTLTAVDNTLSITETIEAEVIHTGSIAIPAQTLYDIARKFSDGTISLKIDEAQTSMVEISSGFSVFHLPYLSVDDFPTIDQDNFDCKFTMPHISMQKIIDKNRNTIAQEDARNNFNGIYFHPILDNNELRGTATDGHRLSSVRVLLPEGAEKIKPVIIPRKTIFELAKIMLDNSHDLDMEVSTTKVKITLGDVVIITKLIDSEFPEYLSLIPYANTSYFSLPATDLSKAVDRSTTIVLDKSKAVNLCITQEQLEIQLVGDNQSASNEKLEIESNNAEKFEVALNAKYLLDILASLDPSSNARLKYSAPYSAILAQAEDDEKTDFVIMPMRV
jgi:DNA polymerase III subunit beta